MKKLTYEDLQPHVEMLIDALENRGASSSGTPDILVYHFAEDYRNILKKIREKSISKNELDNFLNQTQLEVMNFTVQPHRVNKLLEAIKTYFYKEFMK